MQNNSVIRAQTVIISCLQLNDQKLLMNSPSIRRSVWYLGRIKMDDEKHNLQIPTQTVCFSEEKEFFNFSKLFEAIFCRFFIEVIVN